MSQTQKPANGAPRRNKRIAIALATAALIAGGGVFGAQAIAESNTYQHLKLYAGDTANLKLAGWGGPRGYWGGRRGLWSEMTDAQIEDRIERIVKHVAIEIDANEDQQKKITALAVAVIKDVKPVRTEMRQAGQDMKALLLAETIDREAMEKLRSERLAEIDRISKNLTTAIADAAEVLTPEQRKVLSQRIEEFRAMRRGGRRGWRRG